jgi:hypothetical protein
MSGPEFFQTHMGQRFFQSTVPALVQQLEKLNEQLERQTRPEIAARWKRALEKIAENKVAWNLVTIAREALDGGPAERGSGVYVSEAQWEAYEAGRARGTYEAERAHAVLYDPALGTRPEDRAYAAGLAAGCTEVATLKARIVELEAQVEKERKSR